MNGELYKVFVKHPSKGFLCFKPYTSSDPFRRYHGSDDLDKLPYAILSKANPVDFAIQKAEQRNMLNSVVFGEDVLLDEAKDYAWSYDGEYIKPSNDVIATVHSVREATIWFCVNRIWQESVMDTDNYIGYIELTGEYDEELGFPTRVLAVPASLLCHTSDIKKARRLVEIYTKLNASWHMESEHTVPDNGYYSPEVLDDKDIHDTSNHSIEPTEADYSANRFYSPEVLDTEDDEVEQSIPADNRSQEPTEEDYSNNRFFSPDTDNNEEYDELPSVFKQTIDYKVDSNGVFCPESDGSDSLDGGELT